MEEKLLAHRGLVHACEDAPGGQRSGGTRADRRRTLFYRDALRLERATGSRWVETRRPELCGPLIVSTGKEGDTRFVRFDEVRG
jgi:hypothetical protein